MTLRSNINGGLELAPLYDIVSTTLYPQFNAYFAFKIVATNAWAKIQRGDVDTLARQFEVKENFLRKRRISVFDRVEDALPKLGELEMTAATRKTDRKIVVETEKRISHPRAHLK